MSTDGSEVEARVAEAKRLAREAGVFSFAVMETNIKMNIKQKLKAEFKVQSEREQLAKAHESLLHWYLNVRFLPNYLTTV
jgi:hypothetical protein